MIRIVCLGKIKENYLKDAIEDYYKRVNKYHKVVIVELKDDNDMNKEEQEILSQTKGKGYNILLDIQGKSIDSVSFANLIDNNLMKYSNINFIIGSSCGVSDYIKNIVDMKLSFGNITMPHGLFRLVLLEQIYRGFKILNNESYHK